jgi:hypothetical protein
MKRRILALTICVLTLCSCIYIMFPLESIHNCDLRETHIPNFPEFPDTALISETDILNTSKNRIVQYNYETEADTDKIVQFYKEQSICSYIATRMEHMCKGNAQPFGVYRAFTGEGSLTIELKWDKCGSSWEEFYSVEE